MKLNESKGNMYDFVTHTGNAIKGQCYHDCSYCYMKKWKHLKPVRLDEKELSTPMDEGNFIFVGSSCDMFADNIPSEWIEKVLRYCSQFDNEYLFQSKDTFNIYRSIPILPKKSVICTTIETNRNYPQIMNNSPHPSDRARYMTLIRGLQCKRYVTIEPIMAFDLDEMVRLIELCMPDQVNIGSDSGGHKLPEPTGNEIRQLISELEKFTKVKQKSNLKRLLK